MFIPERSGIMAVLIYEYYNWNIVHVLIAKQQWKTVKFESPDEFLFISCS